MQFTKALSFPKKVTSSNIDWRNVPSGLLLQLNFLVQFHLFLTTISQYAFFWFQLRQSWEISSLFCWLGFCGLYRTNRTWRAGQRSHRKEKVGNIYMKDLAWKLKKYLVNRKHGKSGHCLYAPGEKTSGKNHLLVFNLTTKRISPIVGFKELKN